VDGVVAPTAGLWEGERVTYCSAATAALIIG